MLQTAAAEVKIMSVVGNLDVNDALTFAEQVALLALINMGRYPPRRGSISKAICLLHSTIMPRCD